jgi:hypothetical protein
MSEKEKIEKSECASSESKPEKQDQNIDNDDGQDTKEKRPSHSTGYIKDKKTGKWKIVNPAGSMAYNYLYRDEFPDD